MFQCIGAHSVMRNFGQLKFLSSRAILTLRRSTAQVRCASNTQQSNPLPWPKIDHLAFAVCSSIGKLQGKPAECINDEVQNIQTWLLHTPVISSVKLDGTNVGKLCGGALVGRRMVIEDSANAYQGCDLTDLRGYATDTCLDELMAKFGMETKEGTSCNVELCALFGELCKNPGLYNYTEQGFDNSWQVFGAILEFSDSSKAQEAAVAGLAQGFHCFTRTARDSTTSAVHVCNSPAFGELLRRHAIPVISCYEHSSIAALVTQRLDWMLGEKGEGLVITCTPPDQQPQSYKWKTTCDVPQPTTVAQLGLLCSEAAQSTEGAAPSKLAHLFDPAVLQLLLQLNAVISHEPAGGSSLEPGKPNRV
eukprot:2771931-Rhodomonas_salina.1